MLRRREPRDPRLRLSNEESEKEEERGEEEERTRNGDDAKARRRPRLFSIGDRGHGRRLADDRRGGVVGSDILR